MAQLPAQPHTTWFFKFCGCFLAVVAVTNLLLMVAELVPASFWETHIGRFEYVLAGSVGAALLGGVAYAWVWHRRERSTDAQHTGGVHGGLRHAWIRGIIRYWLAFEISVYGFAKILKTQLQTPSYRLDMPMGEVNGFGLTWYYFGYSYTLAVIIALFQIGGSVLLLYRRTTLLGVIILLPVMVNIVFINFFYSIATGAFYNSVVFTLGLTFLLMADVKKLKAAFWDLVDGLPSVGTGRPWTKHILRLLPIATAFALIGYFIISDKSDKVLAGTWKVEKLTRNGKTLPDNAWLTDTLAWSRVYFSGRQGCAFSPNPYRYRPAESLQGDYEFDTTRNNLKIVFYDNKEKADTLRATISRRTAKTLHLQGILRRDTLAMQLARLR